MTYVGKVGELVLPRTYCYTYIQLKTVTALTVISNHGQLGTPVIHVMQPGSTSHYLHFAADSYLPSQIAFSGI
jgi:hypothetical protein